MSSIIDLTTTEFDREVTQSDIPVVLDFTAAWCGPCKALLPALEDVAKAYEGQAKVVKVDIDAHPAIAEQFGVMGVPALVFMDKGNERKRILGSQTRSKLSEMIERLIDGGL